MESKSNVYKQLLKFDTAARKNYNKPIPYKEFLLQSEKCDLCQIDISTDYLCFYRIIFIIYYKITSQNNVLGSVGNG